MNLMIKVFIVLFLWNGFICAENRVTMESSKASADVFPACPRFSPDLGDCLLDTLNILKYRFPSGKLGSNFNIDSLEPFYTKEFEIINTPLFKAVVYDIYMSGVTDFDLKSIKTNLKDNLLQVLDRVEIPIVNMKTKYRITGPFGIAPQTGVINFSLVDFKVHGDTGLRFFKRDGTDYAQIESVKLVIDSTKLDNVSFSLPIGKVYQPGFFSKGFVKLFGERMTKIAYKILESKIDKLHIDTVNRFLQDVPADVYLKA